MKTVHLAGRLAALIVGLAFVFVVVGCGGGGSSSGLASSSNFQLISTNEPVGASDSVSAADVSILGEQGTGDATELWVHIVEIRAIGSSGGPVQLALVDGDDENGGGQWVNVLGEPQVLVDQKLPEDEYEKLELILGPDESPDSQVPTELDPAECYAYIVFPDDPAKPVKVPSGEQTGLKLFNLPGFEVPSDVPDGADFETTLVLNWNTGNSVHCTGAADPAWILRPTALICEEINVQEGVDDVELTATSLVEEGQTVEAGAENVPMLQLDFALVEGGDYARIQDITVSLIGTDAVPADVARVSLYLEADGMDGFDPVNDVILDEKLGADVQVDTFLSAGGDGGQVVNPEGTLTLFVVYDVDAGATLGHSIGARIAEGAITSPDNIILVPPPDDWPVDSLLLQLPEPEPEP